MIIKRIVLENIRSYVKQEIVFPKGTVMLAGDIGSGKTTLLLAIEFALFGIKGNELGGEALLRHGTNEGMVQLEINVNDKEYTIVRKLKKKAGSIRQEAGFIITQDGKTEMTAVELKSFVLKILGYPDDLITTRKSVIYRYTVYTPQEEMKRIITENSESRLQTLRKIFNIDRYKLVRENSVLVSRVTKQQIIEIKGATEDLPELVEREKKEKEAISISRKSLEETMAKLAQIRVIIEERKARIILIEKKRHELLEKQKQFDLLNQDIKNSEENINQLKETLEKNKQRANEIKKNHDEIIIPEERPDLEVLNKKIKSKELELTNYQEAIAKRKAKLISFQDNKTRLDEEVKSLSHRLISLQELKAKEVELKEGVANKEELQKNINDTRENWENLRIKLSEAKSRVNENKKLATELEVASVCPLCTKPLTVEHRSQLLKELELKINNAKISEVEERIQKEKNLLQKLEGDFKVVSQHEAELQKLEGQLSAVEDISKEISVKEKQLTQIDFEVIQAKDELNKPTPKIQEELNILREKEKEIVTIQLRLEQKIKYKKEFSLVKEESHALLKKVEAQIKLVEEKKINLGKISIVKGQDFEEQYRQEKSSLNEVTEQEREQSMKGAATEKEIEKILEHLNEIKEKIKVKKEKLLQLKQKTELVNWLEKFFMPLTETIERHVMMSIYQEFNELFTNWFKMLLDDSFIEVRLDDEFTPIVIQNGYEMAVAHLSGGERTSLALAYRLALNKVINDITTTIHTKDIIILDEPTDGFSSEQLDNVRNVLDELAIKQIIIVSHEAKIESFVENVIYITKHEGVSTVQ